MQHCCAAAKETWPEPGIFISARTMSDTARHDAVRPVKRPTETATEIAGQDAGRPAGRHRADFLRDIRRAGRPGLSCKLPDIWLLVVSAWPVASEIGRALDVNRET